MFNDQIIAIATITHNVGKGKQDYLNDLKYMSICFDYVPMTTSTLQFIFDASGHVVWRNQ